LDRTPLYTDSLVEVYTAAP